MTDYQESLRQRLLNAAVEDPPSSWEQHAVFPVGGLTDVGFGEDERYLLVVSSAGRGVFDCESLEKVARDDNDDFTKWSDPYRLKCDGIGPLANQTVHMSGLFGGGLARVTCDGWAVDCVPLPWPDEQLIVQPPDCSIYDFDTTVTRLRPPVTEVRAFGFSPSGRTLILATSSDLTIYRREIEE